MEGNIKDGEPDGVNRTWHDNGQVWAEVKYKNGKVIYEKEWDEDGNLTKDETY